MADNNNKPYNGPALSIMFTADKNKDMNESVLETMHNTFKGVQDYIDSNIVVHRDGRHDYVCVTLCLDDIEDKAGLKQKLNDLTTAIMAVYDEFNNKK